MTSPTDAAHVVPTHQRITSSKQWVIDRKEPARQINIRPKNHTTSSHSTTQSAAAERESRKKQKELETAKLQIEYDSVKQENDKLKKVILRLKQEIDVYAGLIDNGQQQQQQQRLTERVPDPKVKDLLINTSKRRKRSEPTVVTQPVQDQSEPVSKDDIVLMNTLSDVLAQME